MRNEPDVYWGTSAAAGTGGPDDAPGSGPAKPAVELASRAGGGRAPDRATDTGPTDDPGTTDTEATDTGTTDDPGTTDTDATDPGTTDPGTTDTRGKGASPAPDTARHTALDTVLRAAGAPDESQPHAELGLADDEYARIREILGRRPTSSELAMYSVMWSEHCSYKSSKVHLRQFGEKAPATAAEILLVGIGENAGVVDIGRGYAVTFKVESHNHPSYVEPYHGAATGVGGIVRDILAMGARPVAVMDALRFGPASASDTRRVLPGVVAGIAGYGNCLGLANIGGEVVFDGCYAANPLVNALCVGVLRREDVKLARAHGAGNKVVLLGAGTGPDGIGGASVLASAAFDSAADGADGSAKRPSVQVGDPFLEKLLVECCLELFAADLVVGIQDLGAAGLSCATSEMASAGTGGMRVELDTVPLRDSTLTPEEILMSESQERMMAVVEHDRVDEFLAVCAKWDVPATVIGEVTEVSPAEAERGGRLVITWHGEVIVDAPPRTLAEEGPVYERPYTRPADLDILQGDDPSGSSALARPRTGAELRETLLRLAGSPNLADKTWVTQQYDRYVQGNTVLAMPDDAGMLRIEETAADLGSPASGYPAGGERAGRERAGRERAGGEWAGGDPAGGDRTAGPGTSPPARPPGGLGIAVSVDGNGRYARLDPYAGAQLALAEAYRNVAATGARPLAVTDCLNFGSPEDPEVMWQFAEAVRGLADGCQALEVPVTGGNVSFYNQTGDAPIHPTPIVGVLGVIDDVRRRLSHQFTTPGATVVLLGETREEFGGSEWAYAVHGHLGGRPPWVDLAAERALASALVAAAREGLLTAAHDLSEGGLGPALVESCLHGGLGCHLVLPERPDPFVTLFSESAARAVVAVRPGAEVRFAVLCATRGVPHTRLGTLGGDALEFDGLFRVSLDALHDAHEVTLPALFG